MKPNVLKIIQEYTRMTSASKDQRDFGKYVRGEIDLIDCKLCWKKNNSVPIRQFELISNEDFKEWLESIGWVNKNV